MPITGAFVMPHPPIILPTIGQGKEKQVQKTIDSCKEIAQRVAALKPDTIVLTSPHSALYADYFHISSGTKATGNLGAFNAPDIKLSAVYDEDFIAALVLQAEETGISAGTFGELDASLDHGTIVPLSFINEQYTDYKLVRIGLSGLSAAEHYKLGNCIADTADKLGTNVVFIASGDLSHKVRANGPYGFAAEGATFDKEITDAMAIGDFLRFLTFTPEFAKKAAVCGLGSCIIMAGALDGKEVHAELLSYEGTFGVGYGVASFIPHGENPTRLFLELYYKMETEKLHSMKSNEDEYVRLARFSAEYYVNHKKHATLPEQLPDEMLSQRAGVFVSLKKHGHLRGCIGTIAPVTESIAQEILRNAVSACAQDSRFDPVQPDELTELVYSVDILSPAEPIDSKEQLDVKRYGVIVTSGRKRGLLLPNLEGVDTIEEQIAIALQKAGINPGEKYSMERFEVVRHL